MITCTKSSDEININSTVKPYSLENPIPEVIFVLAFLLPFDYALFRILH